MLHNVVLELWLYITFEARLHSGSPTIYSEVPPCQLKRLDSTVNLRLRLMKALFSELPMCGSDAVYSIDLLPITPVQIAGESVAEARRAKPDS